MPRIILAEDDEAQRSLFSSWLVADGHEVRGFPGGQEALAAISSWQPDLVVADLQMPPGEWGGLWLIRKIAISHSLVPVIVLSGKGSIRQAVEAVQLGARDYVEKADARTDLCPAVDKVLLSVPEPPQRIPDSAQLFAKLQRAEIALRDLVRDRYSKEFRGGYVRRIGDVLGEDAARRLDERKRAWERSNPRTEPSGDLLDFTYLGELLQLIIREWRLFSMDLPEKREFTSGMDLLIRVRNEIAHSRHVDDIDNRKADLFCDELLRLMTGGSGYAHRGC